jgi:hypothetical protein
LVTGEPNASESLRTGLLARVSVDSLCLLLCGLLLVALVVRLMGSSSLEDVL